MSESNPDVLKAVRLLVGDIVNKERYVMLPAEPGEGDPVLGKFRTVSDASVLQVEVILVNSPSGQDLKLAVEGEKV